MIHLKFANCRSSSSNENVTADDDTTNKDGARGTDPVMTETPTEEKMQIAESSIPSEHTHVHRDVTGAIIPMQHVEMHVHIESTPKSTMDDTHDNQVSDILETDMVLSYSASVISEVENRNLNIATVTECPMENSIGDILPEERAIEHEKPEMQGKTSDVSGISEVSATPHDMSLPPRTWPRLPHSAGSIDMCNQPSGDVVPEKKDKDIQKKVKIIEPMPKDIKNFLKKRLRKHGNKQVSCPDVRKHTKEQPAVQSARYE